MLKLSNTGLHICDLNTMFERMEEAHPLFQEDQKPTQKWISSINGSEYRHVEKDRLTQLSQAAKVIIVDDNHPSGYIFTDWVDMIEDLHKNNQQPSLLFEMIKVNYQVGLTDFAEGNMSEAEFRRNGPCPSLTGPRLATNLLSFSMDAFRFKLKVNITQVATLRNCA